MKAALLFLLASIIPGLAQACTVCFGGADANLVKGFTWGIILLLILPFTLAAGLITMVARASRRKKAHE